MNRPPYWFPAKRYGIGWGLPCTWQGWVVFSLYVAIVVTAALTLAKDEQILPFVATMLLTSSALVSICWLKGEPTTWRWGDHDRQ